VRLQNSLPMFCEHAGTYLANGINACIHTTECEMLERV